MKIGIVTDSTCDLNKKIIEKYNIEVIPLSVHFGETVYQDGKDINSEQFFSKLAEADELPRTSQPAIGLFINKYEEMAEQYDLILSIHLSAKFSGTVETAQLAAQQLSHLKIKVIDTHSVTLGLGFLVLLAAQLISEDKEVEEIIEVLDKARENTSIYFTVNDLKYLEKGGRIGKAQAFLGSILNFNPILEVNNSSGEILPLEKVRGNTRTTKRMLDLALKQLEGEHFAWIGIIYGTMNKEVENFIDKLESSLVEDELLDYVIDKGFISPILGCHVGPSVYGIIVLKGDFLKI